MKATSSFILLYPGSSPQSRPVQDPRTGAGEHSCEAAGGQNPSRQPVTLILGFWHVGDLDRLLSSCLPYMLRSLQARAGYWWLGFVAWLVAVAPHPKLCCRVPPLLRG